jgi:uncharacterized protein (DUF433 family)
MEELLKRIVIDPKVMVGKPVIKGTRIPVSHILERLAGGMAPAEIIADLPRLTLDDIRAACLYGAKTIENEDIIVDGMLAAE